MGQSTHFVRYATSEQPYGIKRYTAENRRLNGVLEEHLVCQTRTPHHLLLKPNPNLTLCFCCRNPENT